MVFLKELAFRLKEPSSSVFILLISLCPEVSLVVDMVLDAENRSFEGVLRRNTLEWNGEGLVALPKYLLPSRLILTGLRGPCEMYWNDDKQLVVRLLVPERWNRRMGLRYGHRVIAISPAYSNSFPTLVNTPPRPPTDSLVFSSRPQRPITSHHKQLERLISINGCGSTAAHYNSKFLRNRLKIITNRSMRSFHSRSFLLNGWGTSESLHNFALSSCRLCESSSYWRPECFNHKFARSVEFMSWWQCIQSTAGLSLYYDCHLRVWVLNHAIRQW